MNPQTTSIPDSIAALCNDAFDGWHVVRRFATARPDSHVLHVEDDHGHAYVAKQHTNNTRHDREVHAYRTWTTALGVSAPSLVAADASSRTILITALSGSPVQRKPSAIRSPKTITAHRQAGELLRRLHSQPSSAASEAVRSLRERLDQWLPRARAHLSYAEHAAILDYAAGLPTYAELAVVPCHLDYQPQNWLRATGTGQLQVVDFEHSRLDHAVRDLTRLETRHWIGAPQLRQAFYDGYGRDLDDREREALHACAAIDALTTIVRANDNHDPALRAMGRSCLQRWLTAQEHRTPQPGRPTRRSPTPEKQRHSAESTPPALGRPDAIGRDLALLRPRLYRFSNDQRHYVLAEEVENNYLTGRPPLPATMEYLRACLAQIRTTGTVPAFDTAISTAEGIDVDQELQAREPDSYLRSPPIGEQVPVVTIVGAPRSGTSHLVNLLAQQGAFSYFTTASCWAWPTRNLRHPGRRLFTQMPNNGEDVLRVDNKQTRVTPSLVVPGEAEDVYARAIPVYQHLGGHRYNLVAPQLGNLQILDAGIAAHIANFERPVFLTKTPFSSLRIPLLEQIWGSETRYIHIIRDQQEAADSITRNGFEYLLDGKPLPATDAWKHFVTTIDQTAPPERLLTVTHHDLLADRRQVIHNVMHWLALAASTSAND